MIGQGQVESANRKDVRDGPSSGRTWGAQMSGWWTKFGGPRKAKGKKEMVIGKPYNFKRYGGVGDTEVPPERTSLGDRVDSQGRVSWNGGVISG